MRQVISIPKSWRVRISVLCLALLALCTTACDGRSYQTVHVHYGGVEFVYDVYPNRPDAEIQRLLELNSVQSLPCTFELTVDGAGTLSLNDVNYEKVKNWAKNTKLFRDSFELGKGGQISCNMNAVRFSFDSDGNVTRVFFDTMFSPMPVKIKSKAGEVSWPCDRIRLKAVMGSPDKEVTADAKIQGP